MLATASLRMASVAFVGDYVGSVSDGVVGRSGVLPAPVSSALALALVAAALAVGRTKLLASALASVVSTTT